MSTGRGYGSTSTEYRDDPGDHAGFGRYSDRGPGAGQPSYQTAASSNGAAQIAEKISTNIFKINSNSTTLERASKQIGGLTSGYGLFTHTVFLLFKNGLNENKLCVVAFCYCPLTLSVCHCFGFLYTCRKGHRFCQTALFADHSEAVCV